MNPTIKLPRPKVRWITIAEHPKKGAEYRCNICGTWYHQHRCGGYVACSFSDGAQLIRSRAQAEGLEGGGYRSRGPVLWAMRTLKHADFFDTHTLEHDPSDWNGRHLDPQDCVKRKGDQYVTTRRDPVYGRLTWSDADGVYIDRKDRPLRCVETCEPLPHSVLEQVPF